MSFIFRHCLKGREGVSPYFWPFFHQVKVTKIGTFLLKIHNICMFFFVIFVIIIIRITSITIIIIIAIIIIIIGNFSVKSRFDIRKKRTKLPELGGGEAQWANLGQRVVELAN